MNHSRKYPRSLHARISLGTTSDDRFLPPGYVQAFAKMDRLVLTEKLDGQNNCLNRYGVFARSHTSPSVHPWDQPLRDRWRLIRNDLDDLEIFGENMYGVHSIAYQKLESYYYVFAVRKGEQWLSWEEVQFYAALLDFPVVPEIEIVAQLSDFTKDDRHEDRALEDWLGANLGLAWTESVNTGGLLGGYDPTTGEDCSEGFVVRNAEAFGINDGTLPVAGNEFNSLFKLVRDKHVKTDVHWTKNWKPATLIDYEKYGWLAHQYLSNQS